jgi:hypothetical protein
MDPVWTQLPVELSEHICNQLPNVRRIPLNLKCEIESQRWMLAKSYNYYLRLCQFHGRAALTMMRDSMGITEGDPNGAWARMTTDERLEFYYGAYGPGSPWARENLERQEMFREWRDEETFGLVPTF